jgi:hypothetical protein
LPAKFYVPASLLGPGDTAAGRGDSPVRSSCSTRARCSGWTGRGAVGRYVRWPGSRHVAARAGGLGANIPEGGVAVATASVGRGTVHLFGPEITYRAQPAGTFKLLFNAILNP